MSTTGTAPTPARAGVGAAGTVVVGAAAGVLSGLVVALLARVAMRVVGAMSPYAAGVETDDGFRVGTVSTEGLLSLMVFAAVPPSVLGGVLHVVIRTTCRSATSPPDPDVGAAAVTSGSAAGRGVRTAARPNPPRSLAGRGSVRVCMCWSAPRRARAISAPWSRSRLADTSHRDAARAVAREIRSLAPMTDAVRVLERTAGL